MASPRHTALLSVFGCLMLLGIMPILANARPAGSDGLVFAFLLTLWQLVAALPLFLRESPPAWACPGGRAQAGGMA